MVLRQEIQCIWKVIIWKYRCIYVTFYFILLFLMDSYNQNWVFILVFFPFGIFFSIIFIRRRFIKYSQDQIVIFRGVLDEVYDILSEVQGDELVRILVLLPHVRLVDGHTSPIPSFFSLKITRVDGIDYTIIMILEIEAPIILQELVFSLMTIFIGGGGL